MASPKQKTKLKKKKSWFNVVSSKEFGNFHLGEIPANDKNSLMGRTLKVNLMNLIGDPKKQNINLTFKIRDFKEDNAITELVRYELVGSYIKKITRRSKSKADDSFILETKDKVRIKIKPVIVTRAKVQKRVLTVLRKLTREFLKEYLENNEFHKVISDVVSNKIQRALKDGMRKTYPLDICEFKVIERLS